MELRLSRFAAAKKTVAALLERDISDGLREELEGVAEEIDQLINSRGVIVVAGSIGAVSYTHLTLPTKA